MVQIKISYYLSLMMNIGTIYLPVLANLIMIKKTIVLIYKKMILLTKLIFENKINFKSFQNMTKEKILYTRSFTL